MLNVEIFYPLFGMAFLTLYVSLKMLRLRIKSVREDGLSPAYFLYNRGGKPPEYLLRVEQHVENLFELPVLFYVIVVLIFVVGKVDWIYVSLAWLFLLARIVHAYIHINYNKLVHRKNAFLMGCVALYAMWFRLAWQLVMG